MLEYHVLERSERKDEQIVRREVYFKRNSQVLLRLCLKIILADGWSLKIKL